MQWIRMHDSAQLPRRSTEGAAGYDLHAIGDHNVGALVKVPTGVGVRIPPGHVGLIRDRSGLAAKHGVTVLAGVVDSDYVGEIHVVLSCVLGDGYQIRHGDRIAQLVVVPCVMQDSEWCDAAQATARGAAGFGSTGR